MPLSQMTQEDGRQLEGMLGLSRASCSVEMMLKGRGRRGGEGYRLMCCVEDLEVGGADPHSLRRGGCAQSRRGGSPEVNRLMSVLCMEMNDAGCLGGL
ncbi:hypothetical protein SRHO_G00152280 [Serrasalmus rhombeus]